MGKRHRCDDPFGASLFGVVPKGVVVKLPDPDEARVLAFLREGAKHRDWLRVRITDPKGVVEALRKKGHVIKSVTWPNYTDWVYSLSEGGYLYGPNGHKHEDPDTAKRTRGKKDRPGHA